ncbi:hypothetical protein BO78DRAFT_168194 [Aspergillus sclerotiicarbonarius CBS 121057]|uniref:Uncharacterized protein n=1 Tax=Aspergillus sclerotiicarbonarius (strain CBS 121057 / IBT 28362) TaxID=1448318 RepID=A0A319E358_ASPSB|nr:hypothetical protein BO78DRAFT_168194 [Aspergillus sclerotiicarbonarius CBS 121057]
MQNSSPALATDVCNGHVLLLSTLPPTSRYYLGTLPIHANQANLSRHSDRCNNWCSSLLPHFSSKLFPRQSRRLMPRVAYPIHDPPPWLAHLRRSTAMVNSSRNAPGQTREDRLAVCFARRFPCPVAACLLVCRCWSHRQLLMPLDGSYLSSSAN